MNTREHYSGPETVVCFCVKKSRKHRHVLDNLKVITVDCEKNVKIRYLCFCFLLNFEGIPRVKIKGSQPTIHLSAMLLFSES